MNHRTNIHVRKKAVGMSRDMQLVSLINAAKFGL